MFKLYKITYNDGGWHSGELPYFFYIAETEDMVIANSKKFAAFKERRDTYGGDIWIHEVKFPYAAYDFENINDFDIVFNIRKKED